MAAALLFPPPAELAAMQTVVQVATWLGMRENAIEAVLTRIGEFQDATAVADQPCEIREIGIIDAVEWYSIAMSTVIFLPAPAGADPAAAPPTRELYPGEASKVVMLWRVCRKALGEEDQDPVKLWRQSDQYWGALNRGLAPGVQAPTGNGAGAGPAAFPPLPPPVAGRKIKISALVDQTDETEIPEGDPTEIARYREEYVRVMRGEPPSDHEVNDDQLSAIAYRVTVMNRTLYADYAVWTPYGEQIGAAQKFKVWLPVGNGKYQNVELKGPINYQTWLGCHKVMRTAAIAIKALTPTTADNYEHLIQGMVRRFPEAECWGLLYMVEKRARQHYAQTVKMRAERDKAAGALWAADYDPNMPWDFVWRWFCSAAGRAEYWQEQFLGPCQDWLGRGGSGAPLAPSDEIVAQYMPGSSGAVPRQDPGGAAWAGGAGRGRKSGKGRGKGRVGKARPPGQGTSKRARARQKKGVKQAAWQKSHPPALALDGGKKGEKKGKGKGKAPDGGQYCFSWGRCRDGACKDLAIGAPCPAGRIHRCEFCDAADHKSANCPAKPSGVTW